jgi:hypothetical protein
MVGFWKPRVKAKGRGEDGRPGASMDVAPLLDLDRPAHKLPLPAWVAQGQEQLEGELGLREAESLLGPGLREGRGGLDGPLPCVWEGLVEGEDKGKGKEEGQAPPPLYDQCFQGF